MSSRLLNALTPAVTLLMAQVMRRHGVPEPYEKLKAFTRGQKVTQQSMQVGPMTLGVDAYR
jgi:hypothetical protein